MSGDVAIVFTADTGELEAKFAQARAEVRGFTSEINKTAAEMRATGAAADSELGQHLNALAAQLSGAKGHFAEVNEQLKAHKLAVEEASSSYERLGELGEYAKKGLELAGIAIGVDALKEWITSTNEAAEKIERLSHQLGASTDDVQRMGALARVTGTDADVMATAMERLQLALAKSESPTNRVAAALRALDIDAEKFRQLLIPEQWETLALAAAHFADSASKTAAFQAFGRTFVEILPTLDQGTQKFKDLNKEIDETHVIMSGPTVAAMAATAEHEKLLGEATEALSHQIGAELSAGIDESIQSLTGFIEKLTQAHKAAQEGIYVGGLLGTPPTAASLGLRGSLDLAASAPTGPLHDRNLGNLPRPEVPEMTLGGPKASRGGGAGDSGKDDAELAEASYSAQVDAARRAAERTIDALNNEVRAHKIAWDDWATQSIAALEKEKAAIQAAGDAAAKRDALTAAEKIRIASETADKIAELNRKEADDAAKAAQETTQAWDNFFKPFNSALESQLSSVISGHETMRAALTKALDQMLADLTKFFAQWALHQAEMVIQHVAGNSVIQASDQLTNMFGLAQLFAAAGKAVTVDAGVVAAGVAANQAPILGPLAIAEGLGAAAVVQGFAGGIGSADIGMWEIPQDQLALVHKSELVMPAAEAGAFRDLLSGLASGQETASGGVTVRPTTHFHISSMDGATVAKTLMGNDGAILKAVDQAVRHGAHLGLRGLRR